MALLAISTTFMGGLAAEAAERLGVLRSDDNLDIWEGIERRLEGSAIDYQVFDWQNVRSLSDFGRATVLFLPDRETLTRRQADLLAQWVDRGGQLIVSGPLAVDSSRRVRRQLEELLGVRWTIALPQAASLQLLTDPCDVENSNCSNPLWMPATHTHPRRPGGILQLVDDRARASAYWRVTGRGVAIAVSPTATYFGWSWGAGDESTVEFDRAWLEGAMERLNAESLAASPKTSPTPTPQISASPSPEPTPTPQISASPSPEPTPTPQISSSPPPIARSDSDTTEIELSDPASQTAPPGLQVEPGDAPIDNVIALTMQKELRQLLGRVESAILAARAANPTDAESLEQLQASRDLETVSSSPDAVELAASVLRAFPEWVDRQNYRQARSQWLEARQQLWNSYPNDRLRAQPEVRAIWLDRGSIVKAGSKAGLVEMFDRFASAGINTVFFETVNAGYPIYPTEIAPAQNPLTEGWDPLQAAIELARERGMELHAWIWTFAVGNERHNLLLGQSSDFLSPVLQEHPEWANRDDRGQIRHPGSRKTFLDPANPEARWYIIRVIDEIVRNYEVDGIQLDYIRYPFQDPSAERTYGYGDAARQRFRELTGVDPMDLSPRQVDLWQQWTDFRVEQITSFVAEVDRHLASRDPDLILSVAVFPQSTHDRIHKIQQHWETWIENGSVDLVVPMTYAQDTNRLGRIVEPMLENVPVGVPIVPAVKLHGLSEIVAIDQMQLIRDRATNGYALFAAEMLDDRLYEILRRTQGEAKNDPIPYRHPFKAASARYRALQGEWQAALATERLWIDDEELVQWQAADLELSKALDRLAENPTKDNLSVAIDRLKGYRSNFSDWLQLQRLSNPYQVATWQNRLVAIETLLRYGQRKL
ncbi:family 10 glycosylhydrolase [Baaleninema simplex]|uniref:family 10 glycosylhydrolase n=1 Tax=Baaleninema simplex TaxID=2862350 RepID=UPI0008FC0DB8|nr:family 10 glycosylhydrolase [Baaleninema simplex]